MQIPAVAQPARAPLYFYPDLFTYYNPTSTAVPIGSDLASKAILQIDGIDPVLNSGGLGTAFLIRTFRDDNKVCMCLTGHQVRSHFLGGMVPEVGDKVDFNADIYMDYRGTDSLGPGNVHFNKVTNFRKGHLASGELTAYYYEESSGKDIAMVLIPREQLIAPVYGELSYDFSELQVPNSSVNYMLHHALGYPQMYSDSIVTNGATPNFLLADTRLPQAASFGSSGSPMIKRPEGPSSSWYVRGVQSAVIGFQSNPIRHATHLRFTQLITINQAIRNHCWKKDSAVVARDAPYKDAVQIDNTTNLSRYSQNRSLIGAVAETILKGAVSQLFGGGIQTSYLSGNVCNLGDYTCPTVFPGTSNTWQITIAGQEINVGNGFIYNAAGKSELHLASVVVGGSSMSTISKSNLPIAVPGDEHTINTEQFVVYPNPSADGIYHLQWKAGRNQYRVEVFSATGQNIYQGQTDTYINQYTLNLSSLARGAYAINIYSMENGAQLFRKVIIYQ